MAEKNNTSYPRLASSTWWALRNKFKQTIPGTVTPNYVATILGMAEDSAKMNVIPALKQLGIISQDGKPTDRAVKWRDDEQYPKVCDEIKKEIYPQELLDAIPDPSENREATARWFANHTKLGQDAVRKMVVFYSLLANGDPNNNEVPSSNSAKPKQPKLTNAKKARKPEPPEPSPEPIDRKPESKPQVTEMTPSLNINVQIHISADATAEQIDQIFQSMSKHLYKKIRKDDE